MRFPKPLNGTGARKGAYGTLHTQNIPLKMHGIKSLYVSAAESTLPGSHLDSTSFAQMLVKQERDSKAVLMTKNAFALSAEANLLQTNIHQNGAAHQNVRLDYVGVASVKKIGRESVYNMEVDEHHNFSVNGGMIVHNCMDDTRYMCNTVLRRYYKLDRREDEEVQEMAD